MVVFNVFYLPQMGRFFGRCAHISLLGHPSCSLMLQGIDSVRLVWIVGKIVHFQWIRFEIVQFHMGGRRE